jgi:flagellar protein FlaH
MPDVYNIKIDRDTLHERLNGGLPKGSITLVEGPDGSGKSILSQRLMYGFLMNGYSVTYISSELTTKGFLDQMRSLNYDVLNFMLSRQLLFVPVYPLIGRPRSRVDFVDRLMGAKELFKNEITIIDAFSGIAPPDTPGDKILEIIYFFKKLASENKTIIITLDPTHSNEILLKHLRTTADIYLELVTNLTEGEISKLIIVKRFTYAMEFVGNVTGFRVEPQVGLVVDITTVA